MARYWFVRHGESVANAEGWLAGHRDVPLTPAGIAEARALAGTLRAVRPERVWSSDLERAWKTAAIAWNHRLPPARRTPRLRERHLGEWEGRSLAELGREGAVEVLLAWDREPPGGESHRTLAVRVLSFLADSEDGADTLVFAHGGLIRTVVGLLDGVPLDLVGRVKVANTEVLARDVAPGAWTLHLGRVRS